MLFNNNENRNSEIPYRRIRQFVYKIIRKRIPNTEDAEDITQNVLFRGWKSSEKNSDRLNFETEEDFLKYFCVIAFNEVKRFQSEQSKRANNHLNLDKLLALSTEQINLEDCLEIMESICQLPLKQRMALILGERMLLISFRKVFSTELIAGLLDISQSLLEKLANEIPLDGKDIKYVIETLSEKKLKTTVQDERWKARKFLKGFIYKS